MDARIRDDLASAGLLLIRVFVGLGLAAHGWQKFFGEQGVGGFAQFLDSLGVPMPQVAAYVSATTELLGGALVAAGLLTRPVSGIVAINMLVAAFTAHGGAYFLPEGMEYALNLAVVFLALALTGPGRFSVDRLIAGKGDR
jgi:putative oxidoreductase